MASPNTIILRDYRHGCWRCFTDPVRVYTVHDPALLPQALREIEQAVDVDGLQAVGFLSYEATSALDPALATAPASDFPLLWFGLYESSSVIDLTGADSTPPGLDWQASVSRQQYQEAIRRIHEKIRAGETYQVNYSYRLRCNLPGEPWKLFCNIVAAQSENSYSAYIELDNWCICSASPELFFTLDGNDLTSRPMKGTVPRGLTLFDDESRRQALLHSGKERAENLMIIDMVRNDMGRIADTGSVQTKSLFHVEKYPTVWQMTGSVHARTRSGLTEILQSLFPAASITGAPKKRTMEIIRDLECSPRNIYTGTIGYYLPGRQAQFNVAIRTVLIDKRSRQAEYGVGGGIVWDSHQQHELDETRYKSRILAYRHGDFSLLETLLWTPDEGYWLLPYHLTRLRDSCRYFSRHFDEKTLLRELDDLAGELESGQHKVRVLVGTCGAADVSAEALTMVDARPVQVGIAADCIDSTDVFLYHKTTNRQVYESALAGCHHDDVLLWNEKAEVTETSIANLVVEYDGELVTPPVECGLLAGTFRARLLDTRQIRERVIRLDELADCSKLYLINSVRGWREANLAE